MSLVTLIDEWEHGGTSYRLIAVADISKGYHDETVLEWADKDTLGQPRWNQVCRWRQKPRAAAARDSQSQALRVLTALIVALERECDRKSL